MTMGAAPTLPAARAVRQPAQGAQDAMPLRGHRYHSAVATSRISHQDLS